MSKVIALAMRNPAGLFFIFTAAFCGAQAPARALGPGSPTTTYHSEAMNLDFVYPTSFAAPKDTTENHDKNSGNGKPDPGCVTVPVAVMDMQTGFNMIFLKRYDLACLGKEITPAELGTTAARVLTGMLQEFGTPEMSSSTDYEITGRSASTVSGSVKVPHASGKSVIYGTASCVISGKNIACFQFLSNDCRSVGALSASTVKFAGGAAVPVIPAKLLPSCRSSQAELM